MEAVDKTVLGEARPFPCQAAAQFRRDNAGRASAYRQFIQVPDADPGFFAHGLKYGAVVITNPEESRLFYACGFSIQACDDSAKINGPEENEVRVAKNDVFG